MSTVVDVCGLVVHSDGSTVEHVRFPGRPSNCNHTLHRTWYILCSQNLYISVKLKWDEIEDKTMHFSTFALKQKDLSDAGSTILFLIDVHNI